MRKGEKSEKEKSRNSVGELEKDANSGSRAEVMGWPGKGYNIKEFRTSPSGPVVKNPPANAGDMGSIPGPGRFHMPWGSKARTQLLSLCSQAHKSQALSSLSSTRESPHTATKTQCRQINKLGGEKKGFKTQRTQNRLWSPKPLGTEGDCVFSKCLYPQL